MTVDELVPGSPGPPDRAGAEQRVRHQPATVINTTAPTIESSCDGEVRMPRLTIRVLAPAGGWGRRSTVSTIVVTATDKAPAATYRGSIRRPSRWCAGQAEQPEAAETDEDADDVTDEGVQRAGEFLFG